MSQNGKKGNGNGPRLSAVPQLAPTEVRVSRPSISAPAEGTALDGGKWVVEEQLGKGGMGVVVLASHAVLRHRVAIKILPTEVVEGLTSVAAREEAKKRLLREARIMASAKSPYIVKVWDFFEDMAGLCLVLPYMDQGDMAGLLSKKERLPIHEVARYLTGLADGLDYLHSQGVIHRDIKPENILLEEVSGKLEPRIADAGVAAVTRGNALNITYTTSTQNGFFGTPFYISPEIVNLEEHVDARTDIYSLGVVVYQMLTGKIPFSATSMDAVLRKHRDEAPPPITRYLPDFPPEVERVVVKALAKKPENRWQTAGTFAQKFAEALAASGYTERLLAQTVDVSGATLHASTPPERISPTASTPRTAASTGSSKTAAIPLDLRRTRRATTPRGNTAKPKPFNWMGAVGAALAVTALLAFGWVVLQNQPAEAPSVVADSAVVAPPEEQAAEPAEAPGTVAAPAVVPAPLPPVAQLPVLDPDDSRACTWAVTAPRRSVTASQRAACQRYCLAMSVSMPNDLVRQQAISRGYCHEVP